MSRSILVASLALVLLAAPRPAHGQQTILNVMDPAEDSVLHPKDLVLMSQILELVAFGVTPHASHELVRAWELAS